MIGTAEFHVLLEGTLRPLVFSTCSLILDAEFVVVIDPGAAPGQDAILDPLAAHGEAADDVTDVVISHHHPDHALNVALFPNARVHDYSAIYDFHGRWDDAEAEGRNISPNVSLLRTPGHSNEDISTVVRTHAGVVVFTHAWWTANEPVDDPYAPDLDQLRASRARILSLADIVVPGHGPAFLPTEATPK